MKKRGFCEIKFRSMLLSGTFTMAITFGNAIRSGLHGIYQSGTSFRQ